jgi:hypothetical protein
LIAVRAPVDLTISDTPGFRARPDAVKAALVILSQSRTARGFAAAAIGEGYRIVVDPPAISGAGPEFENDSFGSTDHEIKIINLRGCDDPMRMALILAHELAHVSQIVGGGLDLHVSAHHPLASIRQLMAMEGDARAYEFLVAAELAHRGAEDPEERLLFPQALDAAADSIGAAFAPRIIELAKPAIAAGGAPAEWMARIFKCLYASPGLRAHYESTIVHGIETFEAHNPGSLQDPALFRGDIPMEDIVARLDRHGTAYLAKAAGYLDFADVKMSGIMPETQQRLAALEARRHENQQTRDEPSWQGAILPLVTTRAAQPRPPAP